MYYRFFRALPRFSSWSLIPVTKPGLSEFVTWEGSEQQLWMAYLASGLMSMILTPLAALRTGIMASKRFLNSASLTRWRSPSMWYLPPILVGSEGAAMLPPLYSKCYCQIARGCLCSVHSVQSSVSLCSLDRASSISLARLRTFNYTVDLMENLQNF